MVSPHRATPAGGPARLDEPSGPRAGGGLDGRRVKLPGESVRHHHEEEDGPLLAAEGRPGMQFRARSVALEGGERIAVPFEPACAPDTGDVLRNETITEAGRI